MTKPQNETLMQRTSRVIQHGQQMADRGRQRAAEAMQHFTSTSTTTTTKTTESKAKTSEVKKSIASLREKMIANWQDKDKAKKPDPAYARQVYIDLHTFVMSAVEKGYLNHSAYTNALDGQVLQWTFKQLSPTEIEVKIQDHKLKDSEWHESLRDTLRDAFLSDGFGVHIAHVMRREEQPDTGGYVEIPPIWSVGEEEQPPSKVYYMETQFKLVLN